MEKKFKLFSITEQQSAGTGRSYKIEKDYLLMSESKLADHIKNYDRSIEGREVSTSGLIIYYDIMENKPLFATLEKK